MNIKPSNRGNAPSHAEELSLLAEKLRREGKSIIALSVGQPSTGAPQPAILAVQKAEETHHGYTPSAGIPELRQRIAQHYKEKYNVTISADRVIVTNGASGAFLLTFIGCFDVGQSIGVPLPCYYSYLNTLHVLGLNKTEFHPKIKNYLQKLMVY